MGFSKNKVELTVNQTGYFGPDNEGAFDVDGNEVPDGFPDAEETTVVADCHRQEPCFCCIVQRVGCFIKDDKVQNLSACPTYRLVHECCTDMSLG